jgi:hypothetical protein
MYDFLIAFLVKSLEKVFGTAVDLAKETVTERRKLFRRFLNLYDALLELQKTSEEVHREFTGYATGTETITRTIPKAKLDELQRTFKNYQACVSHIGSILDIYNADLLVAIERIQSLKRPSLEEIERICLSLPYIPQTGFEMFMPSKQPSPRAGRMIISPEEFRAHTYVERIEIRERFGLRRIDVRDRAEILDLVRDGEKILSEMSHLKGQLAAFIRTNFPMDKILESEI